MEIGAAGHAHELMSYRSVCILRVLSKRFIRIVVTLLKTFLTTNKRFAVVNSDLRRKMAFLNRHTELTS